MAHFTSSSVHPLLSSHTEGKDVLIIFSTDRGLCGGLNTNLFKSAWQWEKQHPGAECIVLGKKAINFARRTGLTIAAQFTNLPEKASTGDILPIASLITERFLSQEYREISVIYMDFINTLTQKVRTVQLLPISESETQATEIVSQAAGFSEYTFEPPARAILDELLPYYIENTLYQTLLEAKASEHSARMVSMKNASDNAKDLVGELQLIFNKSRQASITNELLDITTATLTVGN